MAQEKYFEESSTTIIRGKYEITTEILYLLCINSVYNNKDAIFIDGSNTFNPYIISRMAKFLGIDQKKVLKHIIIARAFTEYQMDALILDLDNIIKQKNPGVLVISNLSFDGHKNDINRLENTKVDEQSDKHLKKLIQNIKSVTKSSGIITVISSNLNYDKSYINLIEFNADKILNIDNFTHEKVKGEIMGRTVPSFHNHLEEIISELSIFRRALYGEDKIAFDNLIEKARKHTSSCTIVPTLDPFNCILLSMLIEQQKEINLLKEKNDQ